MGAVDAERPARKATPALPDARSAAEAVHAGAVRDPPLAALLGAGLTAAESAGRRGLQLFRANRIADAVVLFGAAVALRPDDPASWTHLGLALDRAERPEDAAACLERSLALSRDQPDTWTLLGLLLERLGDPSGAEAAYRTSLEQRAGSPGAWQCLGLLLEKRRDYAAAIDAFCACVAHGGAGAATSATLGRLYYQTARIPQAHDAYEAASRSEPANDVYREMEGKLRFLRAVIDGICVEDALATYERAAASPADEADRLRGDLLEAAFGLLASSGHTDAAIRIGKKRLELQPSSATARYLLRVLVDGPGLDRSPPDYIVESFDAFAPEFDAKLVGLLGYDVPEQLCSLVRRAGRPDRFADVLDAGCGTGLCGPLLRPLARELTGVDLSAGMLERAAKRGLYDTLVREELLGYLGRNRGRFDLIVAADVLIYFGDLAPLFAGAGASLGRGGLLAVSTELPSEAQPTADAYRVLPSGRFAHAPGYVRAAAAASFDEVACAETTLRLDIDRRQRGSLFLFRAR